MNLFACHLLNDYSGSPKVLMQLVKAWGSKGMDVTVLTCSGRSGFLSGIDKVKYAYYWYRWSANPFIRLINFALSQLILLVKLLVMAKKNDIVYVNTVLPFGAAIAGKIKKSRVIYHIHETSVSPAILKKFLFFMVKWCANDVIYVSHYLSKQEHITTAKTHILYNAIENDFLNKATLVSNKNRLYKNVLMIGSLKKYKGVFEFINLAKLNSNYQFKLVVNAPQNDIDAFFASTLIPSNVYIYATQKDTHPFYEWADIVLNLSHTDEWVETFGLTILEAMAYKLPAIVPPVGGITELVEENVNGYLVDSKNSWQLSKTLNDILTNEPLYTKMQEHAFSKISLFKEDTFIQNSLSILRQ